MIGAVAREPIAIVGIGCRFPGAAGPEQFWDLLCAGRDAVGPVPPGRWDAAGLDDADPDPAGSVPTQVGGFLDQVDGFDWRAFRIPPREVKYMDPQQRLLLEVAWEALEDAGIPFEEVAGEPVGVYMSIMWNDYLRMQSRHPDRLNGYTTTGNGFAFAPSRVSYTFDLRGPSVALDGACAGSLASIHSACQSLWLGEATLALAGGVNLMLSPDASIMLAKAGVLSSVGRCATLDAAADGFVRGEGAGIVVLKPLSSVDPSDRVYALVRGGAVGHNGHNEWIMAASRSGQEDALARAYERAGVDPARVDYVELHGTGLPKGDPIEAGVVGRLLGKAPGRANPCVVGSVKTNIGHLDSAAGIAGIVKVALSMYHGMIPPSLHLQNVNPDIPLDELGLEPARSLVSWPAQDRAALAGVTAISMSGINAHVVMEGPPTLEHSAPSEAGQVTVLPLSAHSRGALSALAEALAAQIRDDEQTSIPDLCYAAARRRTHRDNRMAVAFRSRSDLIEKLDAYARGATPEAVFPGDQQSPPEEVGEVMAACLESTTENAAIDPAPLLGRFDTFLLSEAVAALYASGHVIDWASVYPEGRHVAFPLVRWDRERFWLDWLEPAPSHDAEGGRLPESGSAPAGASSLVAEIRQAPDSDRRRLVESHLRTRVAGVLGLGKPDTLGLEDRLFDVGLNSLSAVELVGALQTDLGRPLPATLAFEYPSISQLAGFVIDELAVSETVRLGQPVVEGSGPGSLSERLDEMSDDEAEALLVERLRELRSG